MISIILTFILTCVLSFERCASTDNSLQCLDADLQTSGFHVETEMPAHLCQLAMDMGYEPESYTNSMQKLRVIIETDAGGDPDDEQSLVRFLLYANEWDVEGIIANRPTARPKENLNPVRTGLGIVQQHLTAYGKVYPQLRSHAAGFPTMQYLWDRSVAGCSNNTAAVNLIIAAIDRDDPRPVWFQNWGTDRGSDPSNLKRALDKVLAERGPTGYAVFKNKILLCSADKFAEHTTNTSVPWPLWVYPYLPNMDGGNWYHRFGPLTATAGGFNLIHDVLTGHGPLGALYPTNTNIPQKEGDSHLFIYLIPTGMNDPMHPDWGSWAGRFGVRDVEPRSTNYYWSNLRDVWQGTTNRDNTLKRWAADLQNDFRARFDWCVNPYEKANHPPVAVLNGDPTSRILTINAKPNSKSKLSALGSSDPDNNSLSYQWTFYSEPGSYTNEVQVINGDSSDATVVIPADAAGKDIHVILTVRDEGQPPLARYRRAIIKVDAANSNNAMTEPEWRRLPLMQNGKTDDSWCHVGWGGFTVDDGALETVCDPKGLGLLVYEKEQFGNCQIRVVFKSKDEKCNAGVFVRIDQGILAQTNQPGATFDRDEKGKISKESMKQMMASGEREEGPWFAVHRGYEVQIMDANDPLHRTGAIYSLAPSSAISEKAAGEWKTMIITLDDNKIFVDLEGKRITQFDPSDVAHLKTRQWFEPKREPTRPVVGYLGLQNHDPGDVVWFREISVRPLPDDGVK